VDKRVEDVIIVVQAN